MIYGNANSSTPQKMVVMIGQTALLAVAVWLLLFGGLQAVSGALHVSWNGANTARRWILAISFCVVYVRLTVTVLYLLKRAMGWEEAVSIPFAFMLYYLGFALLAGPVAGRLGFVEYLGAALFIVGSFVNTASELLRARWKRDPANAGKLYTGGLFRYSMHVNYFGDIIWVAGLAMLTGNAWSAIIPVLLFCFFAFYNAPMLDRHLARKYGDSFEAYRKSTKKIIPFIY
jgi:steroid 5-alpha reductase family enzyme